VQVFSWYEVAEDLSMFMDTGYICYISNYTFLLYNVANDNLR